MMCERAVEVLAQAHAARAFPAATAEVGTSSGPVWSTAVGRLTFDEAAPPASAETVFDLASLTKVLSTTTIAALLVEQRRLALETPIGEHVSAWDGIDRAIVTVRDLLEHCSGLPAHRPYYQTIAGRAAYEAAICADELAYTPRLRSVYSDPGFMLLGFLLEDAGGGALDQQFDAWRETAAATAEVTYRPRPAWRERTAPTEHDPWRGRVLLGEVHDENAAALGGVAGHAGLFGTAAAVGACARWWLRALRGDEPQVGAHIAQAFVRRSSIPGSSRGLGWDTMLPTSSCGTRLSPSSIGHTGFTGTSLWIDPAYDLYVVLLTNRVHPTRLNEGIQEVRRSFHDAVVLDLAT